MKNDLLRPRLAAAWLFLPLMLLACDVPEVHPPQAIISSSQLVALAITPSAPSMAPGTTLQLEAVGVFSNNSSRRVTDVTWNSADPSLATVNSSGLVTAAPASSGSTVISAASGSVTGSTVLTFSPLAAITLSPQSASLAPGTSQGFVAVGILANSVQQDVTRLSAWSSLDPGIADVSGTGVATALTGTTGTTTVSATFGGVSGTAALTSAHVTALAIMPGSAHIVRGSTQQFRAAGTLSNNTVQDLTNAVLWSSSPQTIASVGGTGLAVGNQPGTAVISAFFGSVPGSAVLKVTAPTLSSIRVSPESPTVPSGTPVQFTALGLFSDGGQQDITGDVTWFSSDPAVAVVSSAAGSRGIATTLASGTAVISADLFGVASNNALLTVSAGTGSTNLVSLTPLNPVVSIGNTMRFSLFRLSVGGSILEDITFTAIWNSSNSAVAFVSQGQVFALSPGTTVITADTGTSLISTNLTVSPL